MRYDDDNLEQYRLGPLTLPQTGVVFLILSAALFVYVGYQIEVRQVFTKSGTMPLAPGLPWAWLAIESFAACVGAVRGAKMLR